MLEFPFPAARPPEGPVDRTHLRPIALTVDETDPGCFTWILMESSGDAVVFDLEVAAAEAPFPTYDLALADGYQELLRLARDPKIGPRATSEDENADPVEEGGAIGAPRCS